MKRYHFPLEKVLNLREYRERERELELAHATGECTRLKNGIDENIINRARSILSRKVQGPVDIHHLMSSELYMRRLAQETVKLEEELVVKEQERMDAQTKFIDASIERKVMSKLKERRGKRVLQGTEGRRIQRG